MLDELTRWLDTHRDLLIHRGIKARLHESPPGGAKRSQWLDLDGRESLATVVLWDSGECEIQIGDATSGQIRTAQRCLREPAEIDAVLDAVVNDVA